MERNVELSLLLSWYGALLTERQRMFMALHVDEDLSLSEIAERENISRQGVHDALKRAEEQLLEMEEKLGLARRTRALEQGMDALYAFTGTLPLEGEAREELIKRIAALRDLLEDEHGV